MKNKDKIDLRKNCGYLNHNLTIYGLVFDDNGKEIKRMFFNDFLEWLEKDEDEEMFFEEFREWANNFKKTSSESENEEQE